MSAFFQWLSDLTPLLQIPIIIGVFVAVVGLILFFVEIAPRSGRVYTFIRLAVCVGAPALLLLLLNSYNAAIIGAAVLGLLLFFLDMRSKEGTGSLFVLVAFLAPALLLVVVGLIIPAIQTTGQAFMNRNSTEFVGLDNFIWIFTQPQGIRVVLNTIVWVVIAPVVSTIAGLAYAYFIDKTRGEKYYKILVFLPMAISFVGASIIWRFVYTARPAGQEQIGLANQVIVWLGGEPLNFLAVQPWNTLFLIIVLIWVQTGFAMVILSAAIKGVPTEQIEAAQLDGTNGWQRFINVIVPGIRGSLIVVLTTISIASLKVFDIVRTMTAGANNTSVIANEMYTQLRSFEAGRSAAFAVVLFVLVLPLVVYNARQLKKQREIR
ncbi:sugar ABC transporter permease [Microbacterium sp. zg.Y1090]|uniref:carbohydrate ABC transporter permease n=1 Tax=Microbacterium TaxID=33882 RepID=UPI00214CAB8D|nr:MULTISPECIES: sugar ABC transporter permease [unclassified Microbacterium]MCR2812628.1 sugar ABC transporter permease [Microbacterium sp. zg.Y1084]MCR2817577.1 sugar ABC transporter permease [Microbacterium sp. zg.Y1090]MDL5485781.1 sugar ABC transporter permease [Microbacterium sp. zg-Y1211]WIM28945.1 sugar ABC transporter permease [Microbacterium sp. zg-Y1090]